MNTSELADDAKEVLSLLDDAQITLEMVGVLSNDDFRDLSKVEDILKDALQQVHSMQMKALEAK